MITVSMCMIVKNGEATIERGLESIKDLVDEIIIVDTGSTDRTKEIAYKYTDKVYDFEWIDDFSAARNYSYSLATKDYILLMDDDDVLLEEDQKKFLELKKTLDPSVDSVTMKYNIGFDEFGNVTFSYRQNRLVKRSKNFKWVGCVHEYLAVYGNIINSDVCITHKKVKYTPKRNLEIYQKKLARGEEFTLRDILYYGNELYDNKMYDEALKYYHKFLDSKQGWIEDCIRVCGNISDYYRSINKLEEARSYTYKTFEYDCPRAEACCRIGFSFLQEQKYRQAIFWYETATKLEKPKNSWGFFTESCWTWLPHLQLCVCYDRIGEHRKAFEHNEIALSYRPNDERMLYNRRYFESINIK
jgi:glycosyltransferase involved in cell wall biosynthesis